MSYSSSNEDSESNLKQSRSNKNKLDFLESATDELKLSLSYHLDLVEQLNERLEGQNKIIKTLKLEMDKIQDGDNEINTERMLSKYDTEEFFKYNNKRSRKKRKIMRYITLLVVGGVIGVSLYMFGMKMVTGDIKLKN